MAKQIIDDIKQHGGKMTLEDLASYKVIKEVTPNYTKKTQYTDSIPLGQSIGIIECSNVLLKH